MKKTFFTITFLLSFLIIGIFEASAATYYVDAEIGDDSKNGTSTVTPFKTVQRIMQISSFGNGDTILFKRGQKWYGAEIVVNRGTSTNKVTIGAYGEGERPVLSGAVVVEGWQVHSGNIYKIPSPKNEMVYLMKIDGKLIRYANKITTVGGEKMADVVNCNPDSVPEHKYIWKDNYIYYNSPDYNPADKLTEVQVARHVISIAGSTGTENRHVIVKDLNLTMSGGALVNVRSTNNITIDNNELSYGESAHSSDGSGIHSGSVWGAVYSNNTIHNVFGDGILMWNTHSSTASGNHITGIYEGVNEGGDGIQSSGTSGSTTASTNKILNNYVNMYGSDSPKGCIQQERGNNIEISGNICLYGYYGIGATVVNNGLIENNYCAYQGVGLDINNWSAGILVSVDTDSNDVTYRNNIVYGSIPFGMHIAQQGVRVRTNYVIENNTFYNAGIPFRAAAPISGEIENNLFWTNELYKHEYTTLQTNPLRNPYVMTISLIASGGTLTLDHNIIGSEKSRMPAQNPGQGSTRGYIDYLGAKYATMKEYQTATGQDTNSTSRKEDNAIILYGDMLVTEDSTDSPTEAIRAEIDVLEGYTGNKVFLALTAKKDNQLFFVNTSVIDYNTGEGNSCLIPASAISDYEDYEIKAFIWDNESLSPLSNPKIINVK